MSGVFINYRVVDNPFGAAGIYNALAGRFGEKKVFRDCVSLEAGNDYRRGIREALAEADVLVSIIGPRWLTLTDDTGARLIDRDRDWVRRELAWAREQHTEVLPVLLMDTPEDAVQPTADELPEDIRWFAFLQGFEFSQLRFTVDLDRLADRLRAMAPSLRTNGHSLLSSEEFTELFTAFEALPCMSDDNTRAFLVNQLSPAISGTIQYFGIRRLHIMAILRTCLNYELGLTELVAVIAHVEGTSSLAYQHLTATLTRLVPGRVSL